LLSDPDHKVAADFGVWGEKRRYGKSFMGIIRSSFLIDENGLIENVWYKISPKNTVIELMKVVGRNEKIFTHGQKGAIDEENCLSVCCLSFYRDSKCRHGN
jgi:alkyl hydroperoxide reductase subunit AhpC